MASRSRAYTRNDPSGRFRPAPTAEQRRQAEETAAALAPAAPSAAVRPDVYFERQRQMERAVAPLFAVGVFVVAPLIVWLLSEL